MMRKASLLAALTAVAVMTAPLATAQAGPGVFRLTQPQVAADGLSVKGSICRTSSQRFAASPLVSVEQNGRTVAAPVALHGDIRAAGPGCFHYRAALDHGAGPVKVCIARRLDADNRRCVTAPA